MKLSLPWLQPAYTLTEIKISMNSYSDYGTYRLTYTPPESQGNEDYPAIAIEMSTSGDANVDQMLRFYEAFLAASGYFLKGDLQVIERDTNVSEFRFSSVSSII